MSAELVSEQEYVSTLYSRLDELREEAQQQLEAVRRSNPGGTHQNRSERDAFARIYEDRVTQLTEIDERLASAALSSSRSKENQPIAISGESDFATRIFSRSCSTGACRRLARSTRRQQRPR